MIVTRFFKYKSRVAVITLSFCIFMLFYFCTIVYSAFSSTMNISGVGFSRVEVDVRITDFSIKDTTNSSISMYENFSKDTISSEVSLKSNSSITYNLEITNYGSVDVGIYSISGIPDGVNYSIEGYNLKDKICDDSGKCNSFIKKTYELTLSSTSAYSGSIQIIFDFRTYHKVTYTGINIDSSYPTEVMDGTDLVINFKENLNNISILSNDVEINYYDTISSGQTITVENVDSEIEIKFIPPGIKAELVSGSVDVVGSEVCIDDQCFYIISNDGSTVTMLAKYNLYVGGKYENSTWTAYGEEATGRQDPTMLGYVFEQSVRNGTVNFSATKYWEEVSKGTYIYDSNSLLYQYVENYKTYLESQGVVLKEARLIKYNELKSLGCSNSSTCPSAPSWIYGTSYWTGSFYDEDNVYAVGSRGNFGRNIYSDSSDCGVRPVVEIDIDEISIPPVAKLVSGDLDTVGSEICIKDECFYIISSDNSKVTMLAKYNLYVGNVCTSTSSCTAYGSEATGLQNSTMLGYVPGQTARNGTIPFSSSYYWGSVSEPVYVYNSNSIAYNYIESYKTYLKNQGAIVEEARTIKLEELEALGCNRTNNTCTSGPAWTYTTSYWTGTAASNSTVWRIFASGSFNTGTYSSQNYYGVRPVITILRKDIDVEIDTSTGNGYDFSATLSGYPVMADAGIEAIISFDDTVPESFPINANFYLKYSSEDDSAYQLVHSDVITNNSDYYYSDYSVDIYQSYDLKVVLESNDGVTKTYYSTVYTECFVSGTKVLVEGGYRNIEDIKVGDYVYALDLDTNERVLKKVTRKYEGSAIETYEIVVNGEKIITTPKHEFYVIDKGWIRAFDLEVGDVLNSFNNGKLEITDIRYIKHEKPVKVYNMTIEGLHNYLISGDQLLVHNSASYV